MLLKIFFIFTLVSLQLSAGLIHFDISPQKKNSDKVKIDILDSVILDFDRIDSQKFFGISALAYDKQSSILYMLSDRSRLFAFKLVLKNDKIKTLTPLYGKRLRDKYGHKFFIKKSDSEGMTLVEENDRKSLLISFEHQVRVTEFDLTGNEIEKKEKSLEDVKRDLRLKKLPKILQTKKLYKSANSMLESVTVTEKFGMVTTPEFPLKTTKFGYHGLYNQKGRICYVKKSNPYIAITELETLPDGSLLALGRDFDLIPHLNIDLMLIKIDLNEVKNGICKSEDILNVSTNDGWALDNFEGLAHIKDNLFLMISDDNNNPFQKTILVLFSL